MHVQKLSGLLPIAFCTVLSGCATTTTVTENPASAKLDAMEMPELKPGTRVVQIDKLSGNERHYDILSMNEDGSHKGINQDGCEWQSLGDHIAPAMSWGSCGGSGEWSSGENRNISKSGNIWPLAEGNKISYTFTQVNGRGEVKGTTKRNCKVNGQVNIETALGSMDTYKVTCVRRKDSWSQTRVYYFSPEHDHVVKFVQSSSGDGIQRDVELLRVESI